MHSDIIGLKRKRSDDEAARAALVEFMQKATDPESQFVLELRVIGPQEAPPNQMAPFSFDTFFKARVEFERRKPSSDDDHNDDDTAPESGEQPDLTKFLEQNPDGSAKGRVQIKEVLFRDTEEAILFESLCGKTIRALGTDDFVTVLSQFNTFEDSVLRGPDFDFPPQSQTIFAASSDLSYQGNTAFVILVPKPDEESDSQTQEM